MRKSNSNAGKIGVKCSGFRQFGSFYSLRDQLRDAATLTKRISE